MEKGERLKKQLTLFDVYAISTGAMFSSGFFLLPGLAVLYSGPAACLAYLLASIFVIPAMFSQAELATAMPKAGGTYYFLDRSLGPIVGTIGGIGTWLALILKTAFALIGMGAYLHLYMDVSITNVALALTAVFTAINVIGAKESSNLQRVLVIVLLAVLSLFVVQGLYEIWGMPGGTDILKVRMDGFFSKGASGILTAIGLVFVSYGGLTKVASVAEEVQDPDRTIPLGMILSLLTATAVYVVGVFIMIAVLEPGNLTRDLTPVATTQMAYTSGWLPASLGTLLVVIAAFAAFASTANAGIMSSSRYLLAMARDRLIFPIFEKLGRFRTPTPAILGTVAVLVLLLLTLDVEGVAKLASAFQLFIFALLNVALIVMRESGLQSYDPGFRSPLYPWMQIVGCLAPVALIAELGQMPMLFTVGVVGVSLAWYFGYARRRVTRSGAIFHWFERLGQHRYEGLDSELRTILKEKGVRVEDSFGEVVARAKLVEIPGGVPYRALVKRVVVHLAERVPFTAAELEERFMSRQATGATPGAYGAVLPHIRLPDIEHTELVMVRSLAGIQLGLEDLVALDFEHIHAAFFLVSPEGHPGQHLRILAGIATQVDDEHFMPRWLKGGGEQQLKELLMQDERFLALDLTPGTPSEALIGQRIRDWKKPEGCLVALLTRGNRTLVSTGRMELHPYDRLTIIGEPAGIRKILEDLGPPPDKE